MNEFNCTGCGLCCATIGKMVEDAKNSDQNNELLKLAADFPHKYDEKGRCEMLNRDNTCAVYDHRPLICNVKDTHKKFFNHMSQQQFFSINEQICKDLQQEQQNSDNDEI